MSETTVSLASDEDSGSRSIAPAWTAWACAGATLLGAFLLFQIQPLISKFILPWFGGAPAVWTTCMLFFQLVLFGGYAYSHLLVGRLSRRGQVVAQCLLLLAAIAVLPIAPSLLWKPADLSAPTLRILLLLASTVGLPYFVLSTTSPLIQTWFRRSFPGRAPYRLYSLSNFGSFLALLSYPFVFEPAFDLATQSRLWSWAFPVYAALTAVCGAAVWRLDRGSAEGAVAPDSKTGASREQVIGLGASSPRWGHRILWLLLPACASLVLLATTNHVCQDVAVVPFLWVVPLSLYLLSFIICFDHLRWYVRPLWASLTLIGIAAVMGGASLTYVHELALHFATMFFICMVCHGELVRLRPDPRHLTEFYLMLSAGGVLGSAAVSLAAPHLFKTFVEWNIGMLAAYVLATVVLFLAVPKTGQLRSAAFLLCGVAVGGLLAVLAGQWAPGPQGPSGPRVVDRQRNFYGVVSVWEVDGDKPERHRFCMKHGAILHGEQFVALEKRREPLTYYTHESGVGRAILELQKRCDHIHVGLVGLGAGTLACYARPGDHFAFYEINPAVREMAEKHFTYLSDARDRGATIDLNMGDARLVLERQDSQKFDLLVLDAFSGDSVPVHLLTREAMNLYRRHVAADDVIAIDATNAHLYLFPVVRALAEDAHFGQRRVYMTENESLFRLRSDWVVISGAQTFLRAIPNVPPPETQHDDFAIPVWTDQNSNEFRILIGSP
ncbi:MAG: fused MFS/spermidine synthase [Thermoguttaceae bacterium]